jgi:hypothetical protein
MALTKAQAEEVAERARAAGEYGEIEIVKCGDYGYIVHGRKVLNGQGIGRTWTRTDDERHLAKRGTYRRDEGRGQ